MGGSLYGFLERRTIFENDKGDWELVLKTEPITGTTGNFREIFYNYQHKDVFEDFPMNRGFPDDISAETRSVMYSRIRFGHIDVEDVKFSAEELETIGRIPDNEFGDYRWALDLDFYRNFEESAFWITGDQFREIDFQQTANKDKIEEIRSGLEENGYGHDTGELQRLFKLTIDGQEYSKLWITHNEEIDLSAEDIRNLIIEESVKKDGRVLKIEPRTIKEILGDPWRRVWDILKNIRERKREEVRLIFYWNH